MALRTRTWVVLALVIATACTSVPAANSPFAPTEAPSTNGAPVEPSPPAGEEPADPTSHQKINAAQQRGEIDDEEALVYKLYAVFGDPRLPDEYRGDDADLHADAAISEATARLDELSPEARAIVEPFLTWPGDPGSWLQQRALAARPVAAVGGIAHHLPGHENEIPLNLITYDGSPHVRFWYRDDRPGDIEIAKQLAADVDGHIWPRLTALMGEPLSDEGIPYMQGEDGRVDIVLTGDPKLRAFAQPYRCGEETHGFIALGLNDGAPVVAHELMHVILFRFDLATGCNWPEYMWLHEASAQWSMDYVYPDGQSERGRKGTLPKKCFLDVPGYPLDLRNDCHEYGAYLFMQYLAHNYSPNRIPAIWAAAANNDSVTAIDGAMSDAGGLADTWPDFALAAYNIEPSTRFRDWDDFTYGAKLATDEQATLGGAPSREYEVRADVEHLASFNHRFRFDDRDIQHVRFIHPFADGSQPSARVTALIARAGEPWAIEDWTGRDSSDICWSDGGAPLDELVLIITNSEYRNRAHVLQLTDQPTLTVARTCSAKGTITYRREKHGSYTSARDYPVQVDVVETATIEFDLEAVEGAEDMLEAVDTRVTWSYSLNSIERGDGCEIVERAEGSGSFDTGYGGPMITLGMDEDFNVDPTRYTLLVAGAPDYPRDGDPNTHYKVWSSACGMGIVPDEFQWWPYFVSGTELSGTLPEDGDTLTGSETRTIDPASADGLPWTVTVTWTIDLSDD